MHPRSKHPMPPCAEAPLISHCCRTAQLDKADLILYWDRKKAPPRSDRFFAKWSACADDGRRQVLCDAIPGEKTAKGVFSWRGVFEKASGVALDCKAWGAMKSQVRGRTDDDR